jgi:hypothetical protein
LKGFHFLSTAAAANERSPHNTACKTMISMKPEWFGTTVEQRPDLV